MEPTVNGNGNGNGQQAEPPRRLVRPKWEQIVRESVQVSVHISRWWGSEKLSLEDLGLDGLAPEFQTAANEVLNLGEQRLMPAAYMKRFRAIAEQGRRRAREWGITSPWGGYLIPKVAFPKWLAEVTQIRADYLRLVDEVVEKYDEWTRDLRREYREVAKVRLALRDGRDLATAHAHYSQAEQQADVEAIAEAILSRIPSAATIRSFFAFSWEVADVERPLVLAEGVSVADLEKRALDAEAKLAYLDRRIEARRQAAIDSEAWEKARIRLEADRQAAALEVEAERRRLDTERQIREEVERTWVEGRKRQIEETLTNAGKTVLELLAGTAKNVAESLATGEKLKGSPMRALANLVDKLGQMNTLFQDEEIAQVTQAIKRAADIARQQQSPKDLSAVLADVRVVANQHLLDLRRETRCHLDEELEVKAVSPSRLRSARRRLQLAELPETVKVRPEGVKPSPVAPVELPTRTRGRRGAVAL